MNLIYGKIGQARYLRKNQTRAEKLLWRKLRAKRFHGFKFRRQVPIGGKYIADFVCMEKRLIVEVDGWVHFYRRSYDRRRDQYLENLGFTVIRFANSQVTECTDYVLESIYEYTNNKPSPSIRGGG